MVNEGSALPSPDRPDAPSVVALEQFLRHLRSLQQLFEVPAVCDRELVLRAEMRKTMTALADALTDAADSEPVLFMAALYREAASKAARLAQTAPGWRSGH